MARVAQLLFLAIVAFFVITEGVPWIRQWVEGVSPEKLEGRADPSLDPSGYCVHLAHQAGAFVARELRSVAPPPADVSSWWDAGDEMESRVRTAETACSCAGDACKVASRALGEIRTLVEEANRLLHGEPGVVPNFARRQEEIDVLLEQARIETR
jgi:hypothetical protein